MSPTSYQAALPRVIPSLLSATLIIIPYSNGFVKRVRKVFLQQKQRAKTRLLTFFPESQQPRQFTPLREGRHMATCFITISYYFNSRPSARGDTQVISPMVTSLHFNSRPSARGDIAAPARPRCTRYFNSRPSARGDQILKRHPIGKPISIHAPPRGATFGIVELDNSKIFQFTPLREGRPHTPSWTSSAAISIHAPPRGATGRPVVNAKYLLISIHAPPRGATCARAAAAASEAHFNSRPSARGDSCGCFNGSIDEFQFTPLREGRRRDFRHPLHRLYFNSRPSARGDMQLIQYAPRRPHFNSRPSARGDADQHHQPTSRPAISIHAPPRGATLKAVLKDATGQISIHAPPRGATPTC